MRPYYCLLLPVFFSLLSCNKADNTLFKKIEADDHGIAFQNTISESDSLNILTLEYIYNGGGVAVADFNLDGLSDVYFSGNMVPGKLYLNKGDLEFADITQESGMTFDKSKWYSGVAVGDVNGDGLPDLYICATINEDAAKRENVLYINKGVKDGIPQFVDEARQYGVNFNGFSSGAAFIDYDNDDDLDLYIMTNIIEKGIPTTYRPKVNDGSTLNTDKLYRNNGDGTFTDVSKESGILHEGYGLGVGIADINQDGWQDIYVSNDYITNDLLYLNNKNGTFTNAIDSCIRHQSQFSMGNDIADFNNDALPDIVTLDMLPEGNLRRKTVIIGPSYSTYINNARYGYGFQYVRNMLQINNGDGTFSEIGQLSGVHQTEWSWSPLFADFDNDGYRDLAITNGFPRDITDRDFSNFRSGPGGSIASNEFLLDSVPVVKVSNYIFRNNGDLTFKDVTKEWGMTHPSFSNGASFADFDNDGDLDYIVNNINAEVSFYENKLNPHDNDHSYLRLKLAGKGKNVSGIGAKIWLRSKGKVQYHDHSLARGYISSVEDVVHFGLDTIRTIDTLLVRWPDGKQNQLVNVKANQLLTIRYADATEGAPKPSGAPKKYFVDATEKSDVRFLHQEDDRIDFNIQRTLPRKFSQNGPGIATGDVNNDGLDDFYVGGAANYPGQLFIQKAGGKFTQKALAKSNPMFEDQGALFFDADNDGDADLYVVSGTYEYEPNSPLHQDRLYINDGKGNLKEDPKRLPATLSSGSCVRAADFDRDGDLDLFVGGRVIPGQYPKGDESYLLINDHGTFINRLPEIAPALQNLGMITDALWTDFNNDGQIDLLVAGEFMPLTLFRQKDGKFESVTATGLENYHGWWSSLASDDFDKDGDIDYIAGNLGNNNYYKATPERPLRVYGKDFDQNNSVDAVLSCYLLSEQGDHKEYPVHFWDELNSQSPLFRRKFEFFKKYGRATIDDLLTEKEREGALVLQTNHTATSYIENLGDGKFKVTPLPVQAQFAPVNGMVAGDFDGDGNDDAVLVGNDFGNEVFTGRYDAFNGLFLRGNGKGAFTPVSSAQSGLKIQRDAKGISYAVVGGVPTLIAAQNRDSLKVYQPTMESRGMVFSPAPDDVAAEVQLRDNTKKKVEFNFGSGYLSQSSRKIIFPEKAMAVTIINSRGQRRVLDMSERTALR